MASNSADLLLGRECGTHRTRGGHAAARLNDGRVLIAGGWVSHRTYSTSIEILDPTTAAFVAGQAMPPVRHGAASIALLDGRILVAGGQDAPDHGLLSGLGS